MFGMFTNLAKAVVNVAVLPIAVVHDVVTLGGTLNDSESMVEECLENAKESLDKAIDPKQ